MHLMNFCNSHVIAMFGRLNEVLQSAADVVSNISIIILVARFKVFFYFSSLPHLRLPLTILNTTGSK